MFHPLKIGSLNLKNNIIIAPLAGYTNLPTRLIYRKQGECLAFAEMVSALGLEYSYKKSAKLIQSRNEDKPLGIQLFGPDAEKILNGFLKIREFDYDIIDINCGCSVKKILKSNAGAYLLKNPEEIYKIVKLLKENTDKPVSIKIRSGWDDKSINYLEIMDSAIKGGVSMITLHPRTRAMLFGGKADWSHIKMLKSKSSVPVIGSGDIFTGLDALNMLKDTNCDGVMLARGLIENPFLIEEVTAILSGNSYTSPILKERFKVLIEHTELMVEYLGEKTGLAEIRKFIRGYLKGLNEVSKIRQKLNTVNDLNTFKNILTDYYYFLSGEKYT